MTIFGGTAQIVFTWIIGATGDKLSWVWYVIGLSIISFVGTLLIPIPEDWSSKVPTGGVFREAVGELSD